jgi:hypothetical protein
MQAAAQSGHFSIQSDRAAHRHALPPIIGGLLAPMLVFAVIDPRALTNASLIGQVYLFVIFLLAAGAFLVSVFESGEVTSVTIDRTTRTIHVERIGLVAKSAMDLDFADVATVRIETRYDDDGYETAMPVLVLTTREVVPMPEGTTEADAAKMRAILKGA